jgi:hypothetical protein
MTLLHLVSEQRLQNLLPLLALEPVVVVQVLSASERFGSVAEHLEGAVAELLPPERRPRFERICLGSMTPSIGETRSAVAGVLQNTRCPAVVNITGGTKPMSIGAFLAAEEHGIPTLYFDRGLQPAGGFALPATRPLEAVIRSLTVPALLAAHGVPPGSLQSTRPSDSELAFGRVAAELDAAHHVLLKPLLDAIRSQLYPAGDDRPIPKSEIDRILSDGLPELSDACLAGFYGAASEAGFLRPENSRFRYAIDPAWNSRKKLDTALKLSRTLVGGWFELHCFDRMARSGHFVDLRTGVQAKGTRVLGETDIVGVDRNGSLIFVSCKADDLALKPLEHVFAMRQRAREFGGSHARAILRIGRFKIAEKQKTIQEACLALGVELHAGLEDAPTSADIPKMVKTTTPGDQSNP